MFFTDRTVAYQPNSCVTEYLIVSLEMMNKLVIAAKKAMIPSKNSIRLIMLFDCKLNFYLDFDFISGYYRVVERSAGEWQTKCVEKSRELTQQELREICMQMGYQNTTEINHRLMDSDQDAESNYQKPIKVINKNLFSTLELNEHFNLTSIQPSRKIAKHMHWNDIDKANCYQLEINCSIE